MFITIYKTAKDQLDKKGQEAQRKGIEAKRVIRDSEKTLREAPIQFIEEMRVAIAAADRNEVKAFVVNEDVDFNDRMLMLTLLEEGRVESDDIDSMLNELSDEADEDDYDNVQDICDMIEDIDDDDQW